MGLRLGFVTCVQLGLSCMESLYEAGAELALAITLPDSWAREKSGRVYLDAFCTKHNVPLHKTRHVNDAGCIDAIKAHGIDWLFIIGWSQIASDDVLAAPRHGVLGMHPTLLPEGRGRAAIPWAILKGLRTTGVTLFQLDGGVDTGPIADQVEIPITNETTATELYAAVEQAHQTLMHRAIASLMSGTLSLTPQDESRATEWPGRRPEDGAIDLDGSVWDAERLVRAVTRPYPGAFVEIEGHVVTVWRAKARGVGQEGTGLGLELVFHDGVLECLEYEDRRG